ncbi:metallophosphoesterase family protein [Shouchella patagoniensis]|uniref:metallophosphoesterase family protein n=1 Tax=Shouchella patagoniensis TaxID=228576 RepID=UPI000994F24D|nr:metallophosphoesterase family protein [Shouchella patagoniensis]
MDKVFVIGDIHGCYNELVKLLSYWKKESEQLVFLGDYIDRGPDSLAVVQLVQSLVHNDQAIALKGNHEDMFLDWLKETNSERFLRNGGSETICSFLGTAKEKDARRAIMEASPNEILFLSVLPLYHEWGHFLFVHAGVDLTLNNWKESSKKDLLWIRDPFHVGENQTGKRIIFGHTPVQMLHPDDRAEPWYSPCGTKIGIDGGLVFGGSLHGVKIDSAENLEWYHVPRTSKK